MNSLLLFVLLVLIILLQCAAIVTFIRAQRHGQTFKTALHGEIDALKLRMKKAESRFDGGTLPK